MFSSRHTANLLARSLLGGFAAAAVVVFLLADKTEAQVGSLISPRMAMPVTERNAPPAPMLRQYAPLPTPGSKPNP